MQQRERRIGDRARRARPAAAATDRAGSARANPSPARTAARRPGRRSAARRPWPPPRPRAATGRTAWSGAGTASSSGTETRAGRRPVDLEPAAQHDVLERAGARGRVQRGRGARLGAFARRRGRHARRGLVHAEVRDDVRRVLLDERGEPVAVARVDAAELGAAQAPAGRDEVDARRRRRPSRAPRSAARRACRARRPYR